MNKHNTTIPFSKFVNITTTGSNIAFTFNRLNPLVITTPEIPMPKTVEVTSIEAVASLYGVTSKEYDYATEYFGYISKNATKPEKLTFYNNYETAQNAALVGAAISMINDIKKEGSLNLFINGDEYDFDINLQNITSFSEAATIINSNLNKEEIEAVPYSLTGTTANITFTATATIEPLEFIIQNNEAEEVFAYAESITFEPSDDIESVITKLNAPELINANLTWSNSNGILKLSQISYSQDNNNIPTQIFISDTDIKTKLGLHQITKQAGVAHVPAVNIGTCEYSTLTNGFIIKSPLAHVNQTIDFATGDMASILGLAETSGGYITSGSTSESLSEMLNNIGLINGDYVTIASLNYINPSDYEEIATWVNTTSGRYAFIVLDDDERLKSSNQIVYKNIFNKDGFILIYGKNINILGFIQAVIASVDFSTPNGMTNFNFIEASNFNDSAIYTSEALDGINANKANCCYSMGGYGQSQYFFGEGNIFGSNFTNIANYIGNSWLKAKLEIACANLMISQGFIALKGNSGKAMILACMQEIINLAKTSGIIVASGTGSLLAHEKATIISATGNANAVNLIESNGYYINILPLTSDDIAKEQMRIQFIYTKNIPTNRITIQAFVI